MLINDPWRLPRRASTSACRSSSSRTSRPCARSRRVVRDVPVEQEGHPLRGHVPRGRRAADEASSASASAPPCGSRGTSGERRGDRARAARRARRTRRPRRPRRAPTPTRSPIRSHPRAARSVRRTAPPPACSRSSVTLLLSLQRRRAGVGRGGPRAGRRHRDQPDRLVAWRVAVWRQLIIGELRALHAQRVARARAPRRPPAAAARRRRVMERIDPIGPRRGPAPVDAAAALTPVERELERERRERRRRKRREAARKPPEARLRRAAGWTFGLAGEISSSSRAERPINSVARRSDKESLRLQTHQSSRRDDHGPSYPEQR